MDQSNDLNIINISMTEPFSGHKILAMGRHESLGLELWCLTPLLTISQLYCGSQLPYDDDNDGPRESLK